MHIDKIQHTDELNSIEKLEKHGFEGVDACLMISLFEYGIVWLKQDDKILFVYGIEVSEKSSDYVKFDRAMLPKDTDPKKEWDWATWKDVAYTCGQAVEDFIGAPLTRIVTDLKDYYGNECVFGSSYWEGFTVEGDDQHDNHS